MRLFHLFIGLMGIFSTSSAQYETSTIENSVAQTSVPTWEPQPTSGSTSEKQPTSASTGETHPTSVSTTEPELTSISTWKSQSTSASTREPPTPVPTTKQQSLIDLLALQQPNVANSFESQPVGYGQDPLSQHFRSMGGQNSQISTAGHPDDHEILKVGGQLQQYLLQGVINVQYKFSGVMYPRSLVKKYPHNPLLAILSPQNFNDDCQHQSSYQTRLNQGPLQHYLSQGFEKQYYPNLVVANHIYTNPQVTVTGFQLLQNLVDALYQQNSDPAEVSANQPFPYGYN